jgi:hypothetical protein|tara:strand:- start:1134 stop:1664 length:531 start_codon:yes stop_codon:yes gene_type:complete
MERTYEDGHVSSTAKFFVGVEVEKTPAFGKKTLFVTGIHDVSDIRDMFSTYGCEHIFFGANHSFDPQKSWVAADWEEWEDMIEVFVNDEIFCSLDIPIAAVEDFMDSGLVENIYFIPQIRVPLPYVDQLGYNAMLKIDDKGFKASNPGVWCHRVRDLMDHTKFTHWSEYDKDKLID